MTGGLHDTTINQFNMRLCDRSRVSGLSHMCPVWGSSTGLEPIPDKAVTEMIEWLSVELKYQRS